MIKGSNILITGCTGTFGQAFTKFCLEAEAARVVCFSRDEVKQAEMAQTFTDPRMRFFIGDVRDAQRLRRAFDGVDLVIHAAALKRIEVGHYNADERVKTNILGAMNVIDAAHGARVPRVVALSTDKAYQPISAYGQSKAIAETLFMNANNARGATGPRFAVTRYGNVANSRGSVIPKWKEILKTDAYVPITDPDCTRFWMTIQQACELVAEAAETMPDDILIPELMAYRLGDLAEAMDARLIINGLPPWEKKHESLAEGYSSENAPRYRIDELREML